MFFVDDVDKARKILGVNKNATGEEIEKTYKKLAKKYHPDLNRNDPKTAEQKMKEINVAYDILKKTAPKTPPEPPKPPKETKSPPKYENPLNKIYEHVKANFGANKTSGDHQKIIDDFFGDLDKKYKKNL